jgi:hypothetical protein
MVVKEKIKKVKKGKKIDPLIVQTKIARKMADSIEELDIKLLN